MDQSTLRLPDPDPVPASTPALRSGERRRRVRHKLHSPVYASFNGPQSGMVVDLSELLDLHEDGFAVQTGEMLEVNRPLALTLDLPETREFIHASGQVIWSDPSGRGGIRFSSLPESSQRALREWLFSNLLIACSNYTARQEQLSRHAEELPPIPAQPLPPAGPSPATPAPDLGEMLALVDAVRREVRETGADRDEAFRLITMHALHLTGASGAALAFLTDDNLLCRARAGEPAPPLGAPVDRKQGLSGECVRSALIVRCQDTENDSRVDREICRALGIGSMVAVPIFSGFRVVGLLQVFSPYPRTFTNSHETVLERLVETLPEALPEPAMRQDAMTGEVLPGSAEPAPKTDSSTDSVVGALLETEPEAPLAKTVPRHLYLGLMFLAIAVTATASGYLLAPFIQRHLFQTATTASPAAAATTQPDSHSVTNSPEELRKRAEAGDADAQYWMAIRYRTGSAVLQDDAQAVQWFQRAAEQGHVLAQRSLGTYYWVGRGVPKDLSKAYFWASLAWAQGDEDSKTLLEGLSTQMTHAQVVAAREQADSWLRQHNAARSAKN